MALCVHFQRKSTNPASISTISLPHTHTHTPCLNSTWHRFNMIHIDMTCWVHIHDGNYPFHHKMLHWFDCWGHFRTVNLLSCSRNHFEMSFVTWWVILLEVNRCTVVMKGLFMVSNNTEISCGVQIGSNWPKCGKNYSIIPPAASWAVHTRKVGSFLVSWCFYAVGWLGWNLL